MPEPPVVQQRLLEQYFAQSIKRFPQNPVVLSEGDSWFSFPGHANTIDHLDELTKREMSLLRLEESGDTLLRMTSGAQRAQLRHLLTISKVDALLFSGGENDVVGPELLDLFKQVPTGGDWRKSIRQDVMDLQFRQIADAYNTLALVGTATGTYSRTENRQSFGCGRFRSTSSSGHGSKPTCRRSGSIHHRTRLMSSSSSSISSTPSSQRSRVLRSASSRLTTARYSRRPILLTSCTRRARGARRSPQSFLKVLRAQLPDKFPA